MKKLLILALFTAVTFCAAAQELTVATYNIRNANRGDAERGMAVLSTSQFISLGVAAFCFWAIFTLRRRGLATVGAVSGPASPAAA